MSDGQIAAIVADAQAAEVDAATFALSQTEDPNVKDLAQHIVKAASNASSHLGAVVQNQNIVPIESPLGATLKGDAQARRDSLRSQSREELDKTFFATQRQSDERVLDVLDHDLLPNVKNAMLRDDLVSIRSRLRGDMGRLDRALSGGGGSVSSGS